MLHEKQPTPRESHERGVVPWLCQGGDGILQLHNIQLRTEHQMEHSVAQGGDQQYALIRATASRWRRIFQHCFCRVHPVFIGNTTTSSFSPF